MVTLEKKVYVCPPAAGCRSYCFFFRAAATMTSKDEYGFITYVSSSRCAKPDHPPPTEWVVATQPDPRRFAIALPGWPHFLSASAAFVSFSGLALRGTEWNSKELQRHLLCTDSKKSISDDLIEDWLDTASFQWFSFIIVSPLDLFQVQVLCIDQFVLDKT